MAEAYVFCGELPPDNACFFHVAMDDTSIFLFRGRSWIEVASPYWPAFASEWVRICYELFLGSFCERRPPCHFAGMPSVDPLSYV